MQKLEYAQDDAAAQDESGERVASAGGSSGVQLRGDKPMGG